MIRDEQKMKTRVLTIDDPVMFYLALSEEYIHARQRGVDLSKSIIRSYLSLGGSIVVNRFESIFYQSYNFHELGQLIDFLRQIGCLELARRIERGRGIYYRGRTDLLTLDERDAAGLSGMHLNETESDELQKLEDGMYGSEDSILGQSAVLFVKHITAVPWSRQNEVDPLILRGIAGLDLERAI